MIAAWKDPKHNQQKINHIGQSIVDLLKDVDVMLGTDEHFSLAAWIKDARSWSEDSETQDFLEVSTVFLDHKCSLLTALQYQSRNQISVWGTESLLPWPLNRYATKSWHGVLDSL